MCVCVCAFVCVEVCETVYVCVYTLSVFVYIRLCACVCVYVCRYRSDRESGNATQMKSKPHKTLSEMRDEPTSDDKNTNSLAFTLSFSVQNDIQQPMKSRWLNGQPIKMLSRTRLSNGCQEHDSKCRPSECDQLSKKRS